MRTAQAVVLAGGLGSRLGALTRCVPKPILPVAGKPFLTYLLRWLRRQGVTDVVMSVGYLAGEIEASLRDCSDLGTSIHYVRESEPMGTGGGVRLARESLDASQPCFVVNGDTIFDVDLEPLEMAVCGSNAIAGIMARRVSDVGRYGCLEVAEDDIVSSFVETGGSGAGLINGGVYYLSPKALAMLPEGAYSLERVFLPLLVREKGLLALESDAFFLDIGLPDDYSRAQTLLPNWLDDAGLCRQPDPVIE